jgi:hypothetical protein
MARSATASIQAPVMPVRRGLARTIRPDAATITTHLMLRDMGVPTMRALSALAVTTLLAAAPAQADDTLLKLTPDNVGKALKNTGHASYTIGKDDSGNPMLTLPGGGGADVVRVYFFECNAKGLCEDIMLQGSYSTEKTVYASAINAWNADNR